MTGNDQSPKEGGMPVRTQGPKLALEIETYLERKRELLQTDAGRWVLIKGDRVLGCYDTREEAVAAGRSQVERPFLVHQILRREPVYEIVGFDLAGHR